MNLDQAIHHLEEELKNKQDWSCVACKEEHEQLLKWLKELQAIKEANPNEALNWLEKSKNMMIENNGDFIAFECLKVYNVCKQALVKAQGQEKVLKIIKEKNVDIATLKESKTLEEYNRNAWKVEHYGKFKDVYRLQLIQEEFDLVKEMMK